MTIEDDVRELLMAMSLDDRARALQINALAAIQQGQRGSADGVALLRAEFDGLVEYRLTEKGERELEEGAAWLRAHPAFEGLKSTTGAEPEGP